MLLLCLSTLANAQKNYTKQKNKPLVIELVDHLKHPLYWWPATLLSYPVQFEEQVKPEELTLTNQGREVPFQLSEVYLENGYVKTATLNFISDLPSGISKKFELSLKGDGQFIQSFVNEKEDGRTIVLSSDRLHVRIPRSGSYLETIPGPIMSISRDGKNWFGESEIKTGQRKVRSVETTRIESGELFISYLIKYTFDNNSTYEATIRLIEGYDFIEFSEKITGLTHRDKVCFNFDWTGFSPTHRQAPNHPYTYNNMQLSDQTGINRFDWEMIGQKKISGQFGAMVNESPDGMIQFQLNLYEPWEAPLKLSSAAFWDNRSNNATGIFINRPEDWNDNLYAIWRSAEVMSVKYYYKDSLLSWKFPLLKGSRSVGIACYDHALDVEVMNRVEDNAKPQTSPLGNSYQTHLHPYSYPTHLQSRYGTMHLNRIKDWVLTYNEGAPMPPTVFHESKMVKNADEFERLFLYSEFIMSAPTSGPRQNNGFSPVPGRMFYGEWIGAYNRYHQDMTSDQRQRITAMLLFMAYICADEDLMSMKNTLAGHPNFLADVKSIPGLIAFLFPNHPEAGNWLDLFEKYVELNLHYHTRPDVLAWDALGGRWTENLGTYVWGFLNVTLRTSALNEQFGIAHKKNRVAYDNLVKMGHWMKGALSAPFAGEDIEFYRELMGSLIAHHWGIVTPEMGMQRLHPPQGAHSARRMAPRSLWLLGNSLFRYDPLLAENLMWISKPDSPEQEDLKNEKWNHVYPTENYNTGTMPEFKSQKFTGYGTVLRAAVNTPRELSVHLQQIDDGPNYRWGIAGQGGCGVIYFYAGGKSYSHNGREDVGDRRVQDTDFATNFGVFKDNAFCSIGVNDFERPLYDLGTGKFVEILADTTTRNYAWPDYTARSIMLVGDDYFITYDDLFTDMVTGRFSWFTHPNDDLPFIHQIRPNENVTTKTEITSPEAKGVWYDGNGDFMFLISHKDGISVSQTKYGAVVKTKDGKTDYVFRNDNPVDCNENGILFSGTAGFIRTEGNNKELALFHGKEIGYEQFSMKVSHCDLGISATFQQPKEVTGQYYTLKRGTVEFTVGSGIDGLVAYIDGKPQKTTRKGNTITMQLPEGSHTWQLSAGLPLPVNPQILYTENQKQGATIYFTECPGASSYRIECSRDGGKTWTVAGTSIQNSFLLKGIGRDMKVHVRVIACNKRFDSSASVQYPVYLSDAKPDAPDGLKLKAKSGKTYLEWGQVLGVKTYTLYRKKPGEKNYTQVYQGENRNFLDTGAVCYNLATDVIPENPVIYEYAVSSGNKVGESSMSYPVTTDPYNWLNWNPKPDEKFRRVEYYLEGETPYRSAYYPD